MLSVGGLVFMDIGGFFRGGVRSTDVAKAGDRVISIPSFDNTVRRTLGQAGISPQDAYKAGYLNEILANEIRTRLIEQAAGKIGITVDKKQIAAQIKDMIGPLVSQGMSAEDALNRVLSSQGMSEGQLVDIMGREMAGRLLQATIDKGNDAASSTLVSDMYAFRNEKRSIDLIAFPDNALKDIEDPADDQLQGLYDSLKNNYANPELRSFKIIRINDSNLKNTIEISDEDIRAAYDSNIDVYTQDEEWTLDQSLLDSEDAAKKVAALAGQSKKLKDAVSAAGASPSAYVGQNSFAIDDIPEAIKDQVLAAGKQGKTVGPIESPLGWYVIAITKITPPKTKSFDEVKNDIRKDMMENRLIDERYNLAATADDLFAGGASIEEASKEVDIKVTDLPPVNQFGKSEKGQDVLKDFGRDAASILETGFQIEEGETSPMMQTAEGGFMAVHLEVLKPKTYTAFETVKSELKKKWLEDQRSLDNKIRTTAFLTTIEGEHQDLAGFAASQGKQIQKITGIGRGSTPPKPLTPESLAAVFRAGKDTLTMVSIEGGEAIIRVTGIETPKGISADSDAYKKLYDETIKSEKSDALSLYIARKQDQYGVTVNDQLIKQLYGPRGDDSQ